MAGGDESRNGLRSEFVVLWVRGAWGCGESVSWGLWRAAQRD